MNKTVFIGILTGMIVLSGIPLKAQHTFKRVVPAKIEPMPTPQKQIDFQSPLNKALELHNFLNSLPMYQADQKRYEDAKDQTISDKRRYEAMEMCNIQQLEKYFKDPKDVWRKMKEEYDKNEKELAIYLNSSIVLSPDEKKAQLFETNQPATDQELSEMFMYWSLGRDILNDLYQNPEKWGDVKKPNTAVFPLWKDQKYLVDRSYDKKYNEINAFFGVPLNGRPLVGDSKYDYKQHNEVVLAHKAYITALSAAKPERALLMPEHMYQAPAAAPTPLPPASESVIYLKNQDGTTAIYPETPTPWKQFMDSGFSDYNPNGEMGNDFSGKSLELRPETVQRAVVTQNHNRLEVYQSLKKRLSSSQKTEEIYQRQENTNQKTMREMADRYALTPKTNTLGQIDLMNEKQLNALKEQIKEKKNAYLNEATSALAENEAMGLVVKTLPIEQAAEEKYINQKMRDGVEKQSLYQQVKEVISLTPEEQARRTIYALRQDTEGDVLLTRVNTGDIEGQIKAAKAVQALQAETELQLEEHRKKYKKRQKIDEMCLNGGEIF